MGRLADHEHACIVYYDRRDLQRKVVGFVHSGLAHDELVVFVHHFDDDGKAVEFLQQGGLPGRDLVDQRLLLVSHRQMAFEGGGSMIDYTHVANLVAQIVEDATRGGRRGVRIFADAANAYIGQGRDSEWFAFETWLGQRLQHRVGLVCAYPDLLLRRGKNRPRVAETHAGGIPANEAPA